MKNKPILQGLLIGLMFLMSCSPVYSPYIFDQTAELKSQALTILSKADEPYTKYETKIDLLQNDLASIVQQEKMRKHNKTKVKQWAIMLAPDGFLLNGSLEKWKNDTVMSETFIDLQRKLIGEAFDLIQETEKQRLK